MNDVIYLLKTKKTLFALLALGIILMAISHFGTSEKKVDKGALGTFFSDKSIDDGTADSQVLENKIAAMLKRAYSLEDVSVIITYDTAGEKIIENRFEQNSESDSLYDSFGKRNSEPFVKGEKLPGVRGALVCAYPLSENSSYEIKNAVSTLLGVSVNRVSVIYKK